MSQGAPHSFKTLAARLVFFFVLWLVVAGWSAKDAPVGLVAAAGALWISLRLVPPGKGKPNPALLLTILLNVLRNSLAAGFDIARRALAPRLDLEPGFVPCPLALPEGDARNAFCLLQSLQPGTLPTGVEGATVFVHGLDLSQPIAASLTAEETLFRKAIGHE